MEESRIRICVNCVVMPTGCVHTKKKYMYVCYVYMYCACVVIVHVHVHVHVHLCMYANVQ